MESLLSKVTGLRPSICNFTEKGLHRLYFAENNEKLFHRTAVNTVKCPNLEKKCSDPGHLCVQFLI